MGLLVVALLLCLVQLVWLYKAFNGGGFLAVLNLLGYTFRAIGVARYVKITYILFARFV